VLREYDRHYQSRDDWLAQKSAGKKPFGAVKAQPLPVEKRREIAAALMPRIRGLISAQVPKIGHFDDSPAVLEFVGGEALEPLATLGTSCPDHFCAPRYGRWYCHSMRPPRLPRN